ncbi:MAG: type transport system permease protein [Thermotogaceae bacterium]|nr:type transport system permease protein [Thermotogaceae bacterium]
MRNQLFKSLLISGLREKETIFWILLFPLILFTIMVLIFSNMTGEDLNFKMAVIDHSGDGMGSTIIHQVFEDISTTENPEDDPLYSIIDVKNKDQALVLLKEQHIDVIVEIPENFNQNFNKVVFFSKISSISTDNKPTIIVESVPMRNLSKLASDVMKQILAEVNLEAAKRMNISIPDATISTEMVGQTQDFNYADYFLAGILIMGFFSTGFLNMGINMTYFRRKGIFKRFACTPIKKSKLISATILSNLVFMVMSFVILLIYAKLFYHVTWAIFYPESILFILISAILSLSFGIFLGSVSKTPNGASGLANILFFPMQFLGGLYFPVFDLSPAVRWFVYINPITYLAAGMRQSMGLMDAPLPYYTLFLIPILWTAVLLLISVKIFKWDGGEIA